MTAGEPSGAPRRSRARTVAWVIVTSAALALVTLSAAGQARRTTFDVAAADARGRIRVFAAPGDAGLRNGSVTAVVRRRDGVLVDFWPNVPQAPTTAQLGDTRNVDGLWSWFQTVTHAKKVHNLVAGDIRTLDDEVRVITRLRIAETDVLATSAYRMPAGDDPRLFVTTILEHQAGPRLEGLTLVDAIKWGNVTYHADAVGPLTVDFVGDVAWVGRRGAFGDLVLEAPAGKKLHVAMDGRDRGFWPPLTVTTSAALAAGGRVVVERALAYRPIPTVEPPLPGGLLNLTLVDEHDRALPCKVSFRGVGTTPDPSFGDQGGTTGAGRFVWTGTGHVERRVPPGQYRAMATAGPERGAAYFDVNVTQGGRLSERGVLPRIVETPGWVAADLHLHQVPSVDADISLDQRVIAIAAEGLEFAVASDHYVVSDFAPTVRALTGAHRLARSVVTVAGSEISTTGRKFGHFNAFPLPLTARIPFHDTTPHEIFSAVRQVAPEAVVQVNHPRWSSTGYFTAVGLDPSTGEVPDAHRELWNDHFDAIEVYNGVDLPNEAAVLAPFHDWLNLLGRGHRYTATGSSDSHNLYFLDPGLPRTLIRWGAPASDEEDTSADQRAILAGLHGGHVAVTSGPFVDVIVAGAGPGDTATVPGPAVEARVRIRAVPWVDVTRLRVFVGAGRTPVIDRAIRSSEQLVRFDETLRLTVPDGGFVVALVTGERRLENVHSAHVRPLAFTNPVWVRHGLH